MFVEIEIDIPESLLDKLKKEARRQNTTAEDLIINAISRYIKKKEKNHAE